MARIGGIVYLQVAGIQRKAKGEFSYNLGVNKKEMKAGMDSVHGHVENVQIPFIEGVITDEVDLDLKAFLELTDITVTLQNANGKVIKLNDAINASEGTATTNEGEIPVRFEGKSAVEVS